MRILSLLVLGLAGCGDISNAFLLEDAEFLDSLPSASRHTVALDPEAAKGDEWLEDAPSLLVVSHEVSQSVNGVLLDLLATMDHVRTLRPSVRAEDSRRWGPYPYAGVELEVWNERTGHGRFDWGVDAIAPDTTLTYIQGTHYAGDSVASGDGQFTWLVGESAALFGSPARGTLVVDYDNRDGIDLLVDIDGVTDGLTPALTARYAFRLVDGEIDFQYTFPIDLDEDGDIEDVSIRTRWELGVGGRSDAVASGGSITGVVHLSQCWDAGVLLTHQGDDRGWLEQIGEESDCLYAEFAEVDRI